MKDKKPIQNLTGSDILAMPKEVLDDYESDTVSAQTEIKLTIATKKQNFRDLCALVKQHGVDYAEYQREAYNLHKEFRTMKKEAMDVVGQFLTLKRTWEQLHDANDVSLLARTENGKMIQIKPRR